MLTFGPVPSRRLGRSLGINHLPAKTCCYACAYCQVGATTCHTVRRERFIPPAELARAVAERVAQLRAAGERLDYLTFVPDGEPTLDLGLGEAIAALRPLGLPIAVITNGGLLDRPSVRAELAAADWVSLKVDAQTERTWRRLDGPHGSLCLDAIREGMREFAASFRGTLTTETMLVQMVNDSVGELAAMAGFIATLRPAQACLAVPTRPPARAWVRPAEVSRVRAAQRLYAAHGLAETLLTGDEGDAFTASEDLVTGLLATAAVHPLRHDQALALLARGHAAAAVLDRLVAAGQLIVRTYQGERFYQRPLPHAPTKETVP